MSRGTVATLVWSSRSATCGRPTGISASACVHVSGRGGAGGDVGRAGVATASSTPLIVESSHIFRDCQTGGHIVCNSFPCRPDLCAVVDTQHNWNVVREPGAPSCGRNQRRQRWG